MHERSRALDKRQIGRPTTDYKVVQRVCGCLRKCCIYWPLPLFGILTLRPSCLKEPGISTGKEIRDRLENFRVAGRGHPGNPPSKRWLELWTSMGSQNSVLDVQRSLIDPTLQKYERK